MGSSWLTAVSLFSLVLLAGCASRPQPESAPAALPTAPAIASPPLQPQLPSYRCEQGFDFTVRFAEGTAELDIQGRGRETLLRDAGGLTPEQSVYSSTSLKAEFGLEPQGRGARLTFVSPPIGVRCERVG